MSAEVSLRVPCPECGATTPLTRSGALRKHKRQQVGSWYMVPCAGSGTVPMPARLGEPSCMTPEATAAIDFAEREALRPRTPDAPGLPESPSPVEPGRT